MSKLRENLEARGSELVAHRNLNLVSLRVTHYAETRSAQITSSDARVYQMFDIAQPIP